MYDDKFLQETLRYAFENEEDYNLPTGITRFDYVNDHGWWVRVSRDRAMFRKLFSDGKYGSIDEALKKAIIHRHEILRNFPVTIKHLHNKNLPGEPEKRIKRHVEKGRNQPYIAWRARWYDSNHEIKSENFSVFKYGEDDARALALDATTVRHNKKPKLSKHADIYKKNNFKPISRADVAVLSTISSTPRPPTKAEIKEIVSNDPFAFEGEKKLELHKSIERDRKLRTQKISSFLEAHGKIFCELCHFNFLENYPFLTTDIIEVHHISPLASLSKSTRVNLTDLMLLCSNCHFAVHQGDAEENLLMAMEYFESLQQGNQIN